MASEPTAAASGGNGGNGGTEALAYAHRIAEASALPVNERAAAFESILAELSERADDRGPDDRGPGDGDAARR